MDDALAWLRPTRLAPIAASAALVAERAGGAYEGLLREVAPGLWAPRDLLTTPAGRAASMASLLPRQATVVRASAAWVHAGGLPPSQLSIALARGGGTPRPPLVVHVQQLPVTDQQQLGGRAVTTAPRTACDLLRFAASDVAELRVGDLLRAGLSVAEVCDALGRLGRAPGTVRAARRLHTIGTGPSPAAAPAAPQR